MGRVSSKARAIFEGAITQPVPSMTVIEAGRKGGIANRDKQDRDFYEEIGRKGGAVTSEAYRKARLYDELRELGLLPSEAEIRRARTRRR